MEQHTWQGYYITAVPGASTGKADHGSGMMTANSEQTLELRLRRQVGVGVREDVRLTNYTQQPTAFELALELGADFADVQETSGAKRQQEGMLRRSWNQVQKGVWELRFDYGAEHSYAHQGDVGTARIRRALTVRISDTRSAPRLEDGRVTFDVTLEPHATWSARLDLIPRVEEELPVGPPPEAPDAARRARDRLQRRFLQEATQIAAPGQDTLAPVVQSTLRQARRDLAALRLYDFDQGERAWTMAAGLPIYQALYGRDTLTAAWQAALLGPEMMRGTLAQLARWQGTETNDWLDEQPGRMLHEAHPGPLKVLRYNPFHRYYGSQTTSAFYPVVASELWHWTGDKDLVRPYVEPALRALRWLDDYGDLDGDGFYEYMTRSKQGVKNQAWKDSPNAIVYEDGTQVPAPIATCEEQGFAYAAKLQLSEVLWWLGETAEARRLFREARELKKRFNEVFWMEDEGFYAMGLDPEKRPIRSIGSNPGHCVATAIAADARAEPVAHRLFEDDLFSGWGIRTLSSEHPAYNPYSYHRGSVWPVEHGTFALAFMRYGLHEEMHRICRAQFEAAALFERHRLPEVFSGHRRSAEQPFPALYPQANAPQAWSASAVFCLVQAMLGLYPYAPLSMLLVDPQLPGWLPELTVKGLRVGNATATIRFYRKPNGASSYEVQEKKGRLHVARQPSPWSVRATSWERFKDALVSLLPGK